MNSWPPEEYITFIPELEKYREHLHHPLPIYIRINTLKASKEYILNVLKNESLSLEPTNIDYFFLSKGQEDLGNLLSYHLGYIYPQALASALPVVALAPKPKDFILDLCAAPGGKTTHIAQLTSDSSTIIANDRSYGRLTALSANLKRCGITSVMVTQCRGEHFPYGERFDKILLDAPCSGEGKYRIGKNGQLLFNVEGRTNLPAIQKGLIVRAFDLLKPGGTLVYSTCTLNPEENEGVIAMLLKKRHAVIQAWTPPLPWHKGLTQFKNNVYPKQVENCRRFYPHQIDSVGFFVAKIIKPKQDG